jgi:polyhydroxybutyrate depolymerase
MPASTEPEPARAPARRASRRSRRRRIALGVGVLLLTLVVGAGAFRWWRAGRGLVQGHLNHGGRQRTYYVHLPPDHGATRPAPLVLALHGGGGTARAFDSALGTGMLAEADRRGWLVAFPDGVANGWNDGRTPSSKRDIERSGVDDVGFIAALIAELDARYGIDRKRIYATGISNGGFMCQRLAVELGAELAAVASVTATLPKVHEAERPTEPVSVMLINGTADPLVPYEGGQVQLFGAQRGEILSTDATVAWWSRQNGCTAAPTDRALPDRDPGDETTVTVTELEGCRGASAVVRYRVEGGGHTWPGGRQYLPEAVVGRVSRDIDATREIFEFFARHAR